MVWRLLADGVVGVVRFDRSGGSIRLDGWYESFAVYNGNSVKPSSPFRLERDGLEIMYSLGIGCMSVKEIPGCPGSWLVVGRYRH